LKYAVANTQPPSKDSDAKAWVRKEAFEHYLQANGDQHFQGGDALDDAAIFDHEHTIGIAIDPATGTTGQGDVAGRIYSAHYLRLRDNWRLGVFARADDKSFQHDQHGNDLVKALLNGGQRRIVIGGQQRTCTAEIVNFNAPELPVGKSTGFQKNNDKVLVKWILLSPAIWPEIQDKNAAGEQILDSNGQSIRRHRGGWLPNWIDEESGSVLLRHRTGHKRRDYSGAKARRVSDGEEPIGANLVAALVPKPLVVTGWALPDEALGEKGGAQSTHLALPAGAVFYFEAESEREAEKLAASLNWHGAQTSPTTIKNRRSTLLGEKGFGLGVCGTWDFYEDVSERQKNRASTQKN
jgi:CRISPR-associated protein Cmr3